MKREIVSLCEDKYQIFEEKMGKEDMMMFIDLIVKFNNILEELKIIRRERNVKISECCKTYVMGDSKVEALKGISVNFRKNEFVSILGPSGCGKTTLLNIIGGLDKYTVGDLVINGVSTKQFTDRDWDVYRNHRIGFISKVIT